MKTKTIRQTALFRASPRDVYEVLMDSRRHGELTGSKASISRKVGGKFSVYGGEITGSNLVLMQDKKIVQAWRYDMDGWPKGHYSKAVFTLSRLGNRTRLSFVQSRVPQACAEEIAKGWKDYYWGPLRRMLEDATEG